MKEIRNVKLAGASYQQGPYFQQEGVMKTSVGLVASVHSASSVNSSNRLIRFSRYLAIALAAIFLAVVIPSRASAQTAGNWEPEIVRLGFMQGDVRLSRGKDGANLNTPWEVAKSNTPMEEGFTVATGAGRAAIEFENGTILYLADNSVLELNRLEDSFGVPITDVELVTGTATINVRPVPRELFVISTPSERLSFPVAALVRIDSFLDGVTATPKNAAGDDVIEYGAASAPHPGTPITMDLNDVHSTVKLPPGLAKGISDLAARNLSNKVHLNSGQPITYQNSKRITDNNVTNESDAPADWDAWVLTRVTKRDQQMSAALKASGLSAPVPGLIDMYESGIFFPCEPDGKCWRPNGVDGSDTVIDIGDGATLPDGTMPAGISTSAENSGAALIASLGAPTFPTMVSRPLQSQLSQQSSGQSNAGQTDAQQPPPGTIIVNGPQTPRITIYRMRLDDCSDEVRRQEIMTDPVTGTKTVVRETIEHDPWTWGVCNSGGWIPFFGGYRFVAGRAQHHRVHYMHIGNKNCWVPRNPHDKRGQTPLNLKNGAFAAGKQSGTLQFVKWNPSDKGKLLTTTPKEFRAPIEKTARVAAQRPDIHARLVARSTITALHTQLGAKPMQTFATKTGERTISYNYHSKTFERASGAPVSGHNSAKPEVVGHFNENGQFNSRSNGNSRGNGGTTAGGRTPNGGGNGGYSGGGHSSGGNSGGHSGGGSSGGHSGGGSSGGAGGGHSGGGGSSGGGGGGHSGGGSSGGGGGHGH
jgi:hypothetical protein